LFVDPGGLPTGLLTTWVLPRARVSLALPIYLCGAAAHALLKAFHLAATAGQVLSHARCPCLSQLWHLCTDISSIDVQFCVRCSPAQNPHHTVLLQLCALCFPSQERYLKQCSGRPVEKCIVHVMILSFMMTPFVIMLFDASHSVG
jgi:hypothetical protein